MSIKAIAVVGSSWGDEGKGNLTDHFSTPDTVVVRFNGGAQAGHTVVRNGKRHVFHHFGSGTFQGATTFLSKFFINNPILYFQELEVLRSIGFEPVVYADSKGDVTTPWDMMINQIIEESRGDGRHGSCGVGINETIKRSEMFSLTFGDLQFKCLIQDTCRAISTQWVPDRLHALGVEPSNEWLARLESDDIFEKYIEYCCEYRKSVRAARLGRAALNSVLTMQNCSNIVFEGAQGLLLDEDHYFFPHVTHSHTGLKNVIELADNNYLDALDVVYVTRAYATRHGAGPFPREVADLRYSDLTNVNNSWQGTIRFGHLDADLLAESISQDLRHVNDANLTVQHGLAVTCLDQVTDAVSVWNHGVLSTVTRTELSSLLFNKIGAKVRMTSFGPCATDVVVVS